MRGTRRMGLRLRVSVAFSLLALGLSLLLAGAAWALVTGSLMSERERTTLDEVVANTHVLETALAGNRPVTPELLGSLPSDKGTSSIMAYDGQWYATSLPLGPHVLPAALTNLALAGTSSRQRVEIAGTPYLAVGLP